MVPIDELLEIAEFLQYNDPAYPEGWMAGEGALGKRENAGIVCKGSRNGASPCRGGSSRR